MTAQLSIMAAQPVEVQLLPDPVVDEISRLHLEVRNAGQSMLEKAVRIGELLTKQREHVRHGEWEKWVASNLPFNESQARKYRAIYAGRDDLLNRYSNNDLTVTEAYRAVTYKAESGPQPPAQPVKPKAAATRPAVRAEKRPPPVIDLAQHSVPYQEEIDSSEAYLVARRLLELWKVADRSNRFTFLSTIIANRRREVRQIIDGTARRKPPEKLK